MARKKRRSFGTSKSSFTEEQGGFQREWRKFKPVKAAGKVTDQMPGVNFNKGVCREIRSPCASKLMFVKKSEAAALGTKPGPNLLYCLSKNERGPLVPVSSAREATELGQKYCACVKSGGATKACANEAPALNGMRRNRKHRRNRR